MSRARAAAEREPLDFYATPDALALAICGYLAKTVQPSLVVEPSAGHGPFVRAARRCWPGAIVEAVDVAPERTPALQASGATRVLTQGWEDYCRQASAPPDEALIVGNPPFRNAEEHIRAALEWLSKDGTLALLLRLNLLGSRGRVDLWRTTPLAQVVPLVPRPSFTGGSTDATEYALFTWRKGYAGPAELAPPLVWRGNAAA